MITNYKCMDCDKYIVCSWRRIIENIFNDDTEMGKNIAIIIDNCREYDKVD